VEYDGAITSHPVKGGSFAVLAATKKSAEEMEKFLSQEFRGGESLAAALELALDAWTVGQTTTTDPILSRDEIRQQRTERMGEGIISAVVLDRNTKSAVRYRALDGNELAPLTAKQE